MKHLFVSALLSVTFASASYSDVSNTNIVKVAARKDGVAYIRTNPAPSSRPGCAINSWHYAFQIDDDAGKGMLSLVLTAYTTKALVKVHSLGTCDIYHSMEDVDYLVLDET